MITEHDFEFTLEKYPSFPKIDEIEFGRDQFEIIIHDAKDLIKNHFSETEYYSDIPFELDENIYLRNQINGNLICFSARQNKKIIGYAMFMVSTNLHCKNSRQAYQDNIYIDPEKRGFGMKFINWCDEELKKLGVQVVYHCVTQKVNFGPALERHGYELIDFVYGKRLDKGK